MSAGASLISESPRVRSEFANVLRGGVLVSGIFLLVGLLLAVAQGSVGIAGGTGALPFGRLLPDLAGGRPWAFLWLGVVVLAATPVVRVLLALANFAGARDRDYVVLTSFVLAVLFASVVVGALA
ncbi:MAG TPA: DUF1634 domain-containing protein [Thermoplasmata archaeon]|jgi:uncharacterized membrane protein|nr:DUF1634 domain-containing protein [Thermoplasmata archaeon]